MRSLSSPFRITAICLFLSAVCSVTAAQTYTPVQPDNALTPGDPIGVPPQPSTAGTHEAVSNTNGALSFFLPVLTLPQRGGWNLTLGYYNTSPNWQMRQDSSTQIINQAGGAPTLTNINYTSNIVLFAAGGPLNLNLPTLQASIEYAGPMTANYPNAGPVVVPVVCVTNWIFTDWSGNRHPFTNVSECSANVEVLAQMTDSSDGSWLRLDTSNDHSDITVRTKDGTIYHFPGWPSTPFASCNGPSCYGNGAWAPTNGNSYNQPFSSMVDTNGNALSVQTTYPCGYSNCPAYALTDTIGRTISLTSGGITYKDSNGNSQTIGVATTQQAQQTYNFTVKCSQGKFVPNLTVGEAYGPMSFPEHPLTYTITLPAVNGVSRVYTMQFDGVGNLLQINYPAGGYTKYDYQDFTFFNVGNVQTCSRTEHQVAHRRECPLSSGACSSSQELVTTYTPGPDAELSFNDSMTIQDPLGGVTYVQNQNQLGYPFVSARETSRQIESTGGATLRTIQTTYTPGIPGLDISIPASVTTTLNDLSPALSSVTNYQYQQVTMSFHCFSQCSSWTALVDIDNPTETDQYDYASSGTGTALKKTAQTWMTTSNGSLYDIAGGHLLDRLATRTVTDPATSVQSTLSYGYNSVGDIASKTVGGTSLTSLVTNYQRDAFGNITQVTDPKGNVTKFGYTDTWAQTTCAPGSNSSAYLTSITDALNHITNFAYDSCTGSKASATDPNNARTSFSYDALGRTTTLNNPDGGQTTTTYMDSVPNSATVTKLINSSANLQLQTKTILDGFSRTVQTQLLSDPDGVTYADRTYDNLGRVATVSNPYRTSNDPGPTNGITSTFYDALDRTCLVVPPDGTLPAGGVCPTAQPSNTIFTTYSGNTTTVTDQAGKSRKSQTDALGRLTKVWEDPAGLNYETDYGYDAFGNLTSVVQNGSRQRNFAYDALSRLTSSANPESGTITYVYDADSNVTLKTSPAPNQTGSATVSIAYAYDALNRLTGKTYSDGTLPAAYFFDGQTPPSASSSGSGTVTINGSEQSTPGTYATGSISISGYSSTLQSVTISTHICNFNFPRGTLTSNAATSVANCLSGTGLVGAKALSSNITLTSLVAGPSGNYSLSWSGFTGSISGMSGGTNGTPDSGTVSVTVKGFQQTVSYGSGSNGTTIASALVTAFNGNQSSPVNASSSANVLTLTAKATGATSNYTLSGSDTYNTSLFSSPSFIPATFGFSLTNGCNPDSIPVTNGVYRRTGMCDAAGAEAWSFDSMGRPLTDQRNTNGINKPMSYTYDVGGNLATLTYPSGRIITYTLASSGTNTAARLASAVDSAYSLNYATAAHYTPAGALASLTNNTTIASTFLFNSRLQPCWVYATTGTPLPWNSSSTNCTSTATTGSLLDLKYNFNLGASDNGNVMGITNNIGPDRSQSFTYDSLNRISTAQTNGTFATSPSNCWAETYNYDAWANLLKLGPNSATQSAYTGCTQESGFDYTNFTSTKNQITYTGFSYDAAGNLSTPPGAGTVTYNAENQLISAGGVNYLYDGDGSRVQKSNGTIYWYGMSSSPLDETDLTGSSTNSGFHEYIFFGRKRIARRDSSNNVQYYFADHLGSARIVANSSGSALDNSDFYPFGGERQISSSSGNHYKFTSKERDAESGLDDFGLRYYSFSMGRFIIPDEPLNDADLADPQRLNLYMYSRNNPLLFVDDSGQEIKYAADLKNAEAVRDVVNAILANPQTSWTFSGYVGPNNPDLLITNGDLSSMDQVTHNPDGTTTTTQTLGTTQADIQTATATDNGVTGKPETQLNSTTITIDKRVTEDGLPAVMTHESEHAGEARKDPAKFNKDAKAEQSLPYKDRPQEQRAKAFEEVHSGEIGKAAKEARKQRKQEEKRRKQEEKRKRKEKKDNNNVPAGSNT